MPVRNAEAEWNGSIMDGNGSMRLGSGAFEGAYSFKSRMEEGTGTNPEELIGAAHAGCFSMAFSAALGKAGFEPKSIQTKAAVRFDKVEGGFSITRIDLTTEAEIPEIDEEKFQEIARAAKENCPVSKALAGTEINLQANLK
ncbi:MAG TPA: OsmC family protein [Pyrinomonadaceae bacterium]|nr:OsmC family protein [Pyrinomonadaceae bacterium]